MIEKLIEDEKKNLQNKLHETTDKYNILHEKLSLLIKELEKLKGERDNIQLTPIPLKSQFSFFKRIFLNAYNKDYEKTLKDNHEKAKQIEDISLKVEKLESEINSIKTQLNEIDLKKAYEDANIEVTLEYLLSNKPELAENVDFIKDAVKLSPSNITFDKTNNPEIYKEILEYLKSNLSPKLWEIYSESYPTNMYNSYLKSFNAAIKEIESPSEVEDGRYKIPIKYLFESIRMSFDKRSMHSNNPAIEGDELLKHCIHNIQNKIDIYFSLDGTISDKFGVAMSEIWDNPNVLTGVHAVNRGSGTQVNNNSIIDSIMENGIRATNAMGELAGEKTNPQILATTYLQEYTDLDFLHFIDYRYDDSYGFVIFQIPKEGVGKIATIPIWGIDEDTDNRAEKAYLKPEYMLGYVINNRRVEAKDYTFTKKTTKSKNYKYSLMDQTYANEGEIITMDEKKEMTI